MPPRLFTKTRRLNGGLNTRVNPALIADNQAQSLTNVDFFDGIAETRGGLDRVWATRPASAAVLGLYEFTLASGTRNRLAKVGGTLYSFSLTPATATTSLKTGFSATAHASFAALNDLAFVSDGTLLAVYDGTDCDEVGIAAPSLTLNSVAGAKPAGNYGYFITRYSTVLAAMEGVPCATQTFTANGANEAQVADPGSFTSTWDRVRVYRTTVGGSTYYLAATLASASLPWTDNVADAALVTETEARITRNGVVEVYTKPTAGTLLTMWDGRLIIASGSTIYWSEPLEPTQFYTNSYQGIETNDGDAITGLAVFRGNLIVFKRFSIHMVRGGLLNQAGDTTAFFDRAVTGVGCNAPFSVVVRDDAIYFMSDTGLRMYAGGDSAPKISGDIQSVTDDQEDSKRNLFVAGYNSLREQIWWAYTKKGASLNFRCTVLQLGTIRPSRDHPGELSATFSDYEFGMNLIALSAMGLFHNNDGKLRLYVGDTSGYAYETQVGSDDGVTSGQKTGTATAGAASTLTDTGAAFRTTGNGLTGLTVTIVRAADGTEESATIASNTATVITISGTWGIDPVAGDTYWIGAIETEFIGRRDDLGRPDSEKRFLELVSTIKKQDHSITITMGWRLDELSTQENSGTYSMLTEGIHLVLGLHGRGVFFTPYFRILGTDAPFEILSVTVSAELIGRGSR